MTEEKVEEHHADSKAALARLGLSSGEINAYFSVVGKGICLVSEISKHAGVELGEAKNTVVKLIEKGLLTESISFGIKCAP